MSEITLPTESEKIKNFLKDLDVPDTCAILAKLKMIVAEVEAEVKRKNNTFHRSYHFGNTLKMVALYKGKWWSNIKRIHYSIVREMAPIYTKPPISIFGTVDPRMFSRGKRAIAGDLDFGQGDTKIFMEMAQAERPVRLGQAWYSDQMPPFDILLVGKNEHNEIAKMIIFGVELLNEGCAGLFSEPPPPSFVAKCIFPWTKVSDDKLCKCKNNIHGPGTMGPYDCFLCHGTGVNLEDYQAEPRDPHTIGRAGDPQID